MVGGSAEREAPTSCGCGRSMYIRYMHGRMLFLAQETAFRECLLDVLEPEPSDRANGEVPREDTYFCGSDVLPYSRDSFKVQ